MQPFKTSLRAAVLVIFGLALSEGILADEAKIKLTVIGVDGKPTDEFRESSSYEIGDLHDKGNIHTIAVYDRSGNEGHAVVYVPDGKEVPVTIRLKPGADLESGETKAIDGKKAGDAKAQQDGYNEAKEAIAQIEDKASQEQQAIDAWARDHEIPIMTLSAAEKQIKAGESLGSQADAANLVKLRDYRDKLMHLQRHRNWIEDRKKRLAALGPPEKKVSAVPSTCPEGQSGGLLAGLLNSVTGGNSFVGICGDNERQKDSKDRKPRDREEHRED